ncbi:hypothetical protein GO730_06235 [Spirosoma sp. HMF3257]|uniref:Peptidase M41 FtsH extracellular domain-containing protein n=1 Tax=Spirosoma telluris TaxID=2183553 RepID=A0A327NFH6_9BACT|nr:hypothetical protein [Spirosoma telluris]RAI74051.1 hypothetical protein HMF3257_06180 [Spirosoma telluris]
MSDEIKRYSQSGMYWLIVTLSTIIFVASCTSSVREISQKRFMEMVKDQEVERITIVNGQQVDVILTPGALAKAKYQGLFVDKKQLENGEPHCRLLIISEQAFMDDLAKMNPTFLITPEERGLFSSK